MINSSELRIGNYFNEYCNFGPNRILIYEFQRVSELKVGTDISGEPIPLTPDILKQFNFSQLGDYPVFKLNSFRLSMNLNDGVFIYSAESDNVIIKYVHQLQNLYFALTGEEIEFNTIMLQGTEAGDKEIHAQ